MSNTDHPPGTEAAEAVINAITRAPYRPAQSTVTCDRCGRDALHDYLVPMSTTAAALLAAGRKRCRAEGWRCDDTGDYCPNCQHGEDAETPSNPAPDLARDDDAQSEVGDEDQPDGIVGDSLDLPEPERAANRVREFVSQFGDGMVPIDCVDAPLYARDLEALTELAWTAERLRSEVAEAREDAKACAGQRDAAIFQADYWRDQLADMTAQRDKANRERRNEDVLVMARDNWRRRAEAAEAERDQERDQLHETTTRYWELHAERDTAQAEVKELREELEHWTSGRRRKGLPRVESVPDAVARAAEMVRSSYEGDLPDDIADVMRGNAHRMRVLHDAASTLTAERDALQARIAAVVDKCERWMRKSMVDHPQSEVAMLHEHVLADIRLTAQPADDGSEAEQYDAAEDRTCEDHDCECHKEHQ